MLSQNFIPFITLVTKNSDYSVVYILLLTTNYLCLCVHTAKHTHTHTHAKYSAIE